MERSLIGEHSLPWDRVAARRLARQGLDPLSPAAQPAEIVSGMGVVHAQILSAAFWSIGLRGASLTASEIRDALWTEHTLVKGFGPRGTVHLFPARDLPLWIGALSALPPAHRGQSPAVRLTTEQTDDVIQAIAGTLIDADLTIDELGEAVIRVTGSWAGERTMPAFNGFWPRWRMALARAGFRGALCFGPNRGSRVTYTSPRRLLPGFTPAPERASLAWLLKRYLSTYGPATPEHFAQWMGAPRKWATELFDSLSTELEQVAVDGDRAWVVAGDTAFPSDASPGLRLLPYFDVYVVGSQPRDRLFPGRAATRALTPSGQAGNYPVLLVDGVVAGVWHQRRSGCWVDVTVEPFEPLSSKERGELDEQVERLGAFLDGRPRLTIGTVTAGPHA